MLLLLLICVALPLAGAPLYGDLEPGGFGLPLECQIKLDESTMRACCREHNEKLLASLKDDAFEDELMQLTVDDIKKQRMTELVSGVTLLHLLCKMFLWHTMPHLCKHYVCKLSSVTSRR